MYTMGIDIGTTGVKVAIFDYGFNMVSYAFNEYEIIYLGEGYAEQNPNIVWKKTLDAMKKASCKVGQDIIGISISVQGDAVIPVNKKGEAISNAHLGMDYRGKKETKYLANKIGDRKLFNITGMRAHPMNSVIKMMWIKNNDKKLHKEVYKYLTYSDFIMHKLGSENYYIDLSMASRTMALDIRKLKWSDIILDEAKIEENCLGMPIKSGVPVGNISKTAAEYTNINPKALIITGGHDQCCASLGAGNIKENMALDSHGTAEVLSCTLSSLKLQDNMYKNYYPCYLHVIDNMYLTFALNHTGGLLLKWYKDNFGYKEVIEAKKTKERAFELIVKNATKGISPLMVIPYLNGSGTPTCDMKLKGAILGLTMASTSGDIVKAFMEALVFELKLNIETMKKSGVNIKELSCVGGGARSDIDLQLKADITGIEAKTLKIREAACLGASILASIGSGLHKSINTAVKNIKKDRIYNADLNKNILYNNKYKIYKSIYEDIKKVLYRL